MEVFECKYCKSKNLMLESRVSGENVMTANMVALKCADCGKWIKWCPKEDRHFYIKEKEKIFTFTKEQLDQHEIEIRTDERKKVLAELKNNYGGIEKSIITEKYHLTNFDCDITKPIEQIVKEERKKVCEELEKWAEDTLSIQAFGKTLIEYENIKQKLAELKGE